MNVSTIRTPLTIPDDEMVDVFAAYWAGLFMNGSVHYQRSTRKDAERLRSVIRRAARRAGHKVSTITTEFNDGWCVGAIWRDAPEAPPEQKRARDRRLEAALKAHHAGPPTQQPKEQRID